MVMKLWKGSWSVVETDSQSVQQLAPMMVSQLAQGW